jgi:DNA-binding NarL/FixJ family response regulator
MVTRVLVVDDHILSNEGLLKTLATAPEIETLGIVTQGTEVLI